MNENVINKKFNKTFGIKNFILKNLAVIDLKIYKKILEKFIIFNISLIFL